VVFFTDSEEIAVSRPNPDPSSFNPIAVGGARRPGAKGIAPGAGQEESDPDWQPL
jgi:hypothetical protein